LEVPHSNLRVCSVSPLRGLALAAEAISRGPDLPVQVESCNLSIVSLKINEIEEVCRCLLVSLLSGRKGGITPWTQTSWGA
jgi:hypothetical protein